MVERKRMIWGTGLAVLGLLIWASWPNRSRAFARHLGGPVPASVAVTFYESRDWLGLLPEPVVYLGFSAGQEDVEKIIARSGFQPHGTNSHVPSRAPADGWLSADQIGPSGRVYRRTHVPAGRGRWPFGRNRRWTEYLWIDGTGTNAYFMVWGV